MADQETRALALLRALRQVDDRLGVKNSRIAFDVAQLLYEDSFSGEGQGLTVEQLAAATGYSGPTIRLVLKRLTASHIVTLAASVPRRQSHALTMRGRAGFRAYIDALLAFRQGISEQASP